MSGTATQDNKSMDKCRLKEIVLFRLDELVSCTKVNNELRNQLLQYKIITEDEHIKLMHPDFGATYVYTQVVPRFAGSKLSEKRLKKALEVSLNLAALRIIQHSPLSFENLDNQYTTDVSFHIPDSIQLHGLPQENHRFVGRKSELEMLKGLCKSSISKRCKPVLVSGLGGIGKTSLVRRHVAEFIKENPTGIVIWISGTEEKLQESILSLLNVHSNKQNHPCKTFGNFIRFLGETERNVILVIDNLELICDDLCFLFDDTLPFPVIVTSRNRQILEQDINFSLQLAGLSKADADLLVKSVLDYDDPDSYALCDTLKYFPLSILECANYIKKNRLIRNYIKNNRIICNYDVKRFLNEFHCLNMKLEVLKNYFPMSWKYYYDSTTFSTFDATIRLILEESKNLGNFQFMPVILLKILSFGKSREIRETWLYNISGLHMLIKQGLWECMHTKEQNESCRQLKQRNVRRGSHTCTDEDFESSLRKLLRFSLIEYEEIDDEPHYHIHEMLQTVTRLKYQDKYWKPPSEFITKNRKQYDHLQWNFSTTNGNFLRRILESVINWIRWKKIFVSLMTLIVLLFISLFIALIVS